MRKLAKCELMQVVEIHVSLQAGQSVEYSGNVNSLDGPLWYLLPVHQELMPHLLDQVGGSARS